MQIRWTRKDVTVTIIVSGALVFAIVILLMKLVL